MQAKKKIKIQVSLDQSTMDLLDSIVQRVPDVESRSAAIRWAARIGVDNLDLDVPELGRTREKRR